jgi:hypothetical protein
VQCTRTVTLHFLFLRYYPLLMFILNFCPGHCSYIIKAIDLKLYRMIYLIDKKCIAQKLLLCISYSLSYCPLLTSYFIFVLTIIPKLYCSQGDTSDLRCSSFMFFWKYGIIMQYRVWTTSIKPSLQHFFFKFRRFWAFFSYVVFLYFIKNTSSEIMKYLIQILTFWWTFLICWKHNFKLVCKS